MATDGLVSAQDVLNALRELEHKGSTKVMEELEAAEPDLTEHVIEGLTAVYRRMSRHCDSPQSTRSIYRLTRRVMLVSVMALRRAHYELWRDQAGDNLAHFDTRDGEVPEDDPPGDVPPAELT